MVPVDLTLSNFLSYGENAPTLDFSRFDVACISGANGQGKSSLLDAMTWALWGQARKTSSAVKPDEHLLRHGARRMEVVFTFDHLGERYRVTRSYALSASGKTPKPGLEVTVMDAGGVARVLTAGSISETQERLDAVLKVDFDTFVNASFLVQGRADEFARKKARDRKETLLRLLGLTRYERLEAAAGEKVSAARALADRLEAERDRLDGEMEGGADLPAERAAEAAALADAQADIASAGEAADAARAARAPLDAQRATLAEAATRRAAVEAEHATVTDRRAALARDLADGADLLARAEAIDAAHADHEAARAAFDALAALHADALRLDADLAALDRDAERRTDAHQRARHALDVQADADAAAREALRERLATRPQVEASLEEARRARAQFEALDAVRVRADAAEREAALAKDRLAREHAALTDRVAALAAERERLDERLAGREQAERLLANARRAEAESVRLDDAMRGLREQGDDAKAEAHAAAAARERAEADVAAQRERLELLRSAPMGGECPTCGTTLTDAHRRTVLAEAERTLAALAAEAARRAAADADARQRLAALRDAFQQHRDTLRIAQEAARALPRYEQELAALGEAVAQRDRVANEHDAIAEQLAGRTFLPEVRADYERWRAKARDAAYDRDAYDRLRRTAHDADRHAATLADLDRDEARAAALDERLAAHADARAALDARDAAGEVLGDLPVRRARVQAARDALGFDAGAHAAARARVEATRGAAAELAALRKAEREQSAWLAEQARLVDALAALDAEARALGERLAGRAALEAEAAALDARLHEALEAAKQAQARADAHARRLGALDDRLVRHEALRAHRDDAAAQARAAREQHALYRHLKTAFSRDGIPSLILEDTLPDLQARANDLLARLTEGRLSLTLETLADKKAGGTKETLDLLVSDETGGTRPYETYSGGEAFRISFALRIALSQLLAERADVAVRMLVIDEGFGTQDPQGVQQLVEAINAVKDDFDKVLVITHLDALKNAFPTRIEVRKDPARGSVFELLEAE